MNTVKKLMYRVVICAVILGLVLSSQIIVPKAQEQNGPIDFTDIVFLKRQRLGGAEDQGHHMCDQYFGHNQLTGGGTGTGVYILKNAFSDNPTVVNVLENSTVQNGPRAGQKLQGGAFIGLDLNYDATELVFSYTDGYRGNYVWREQLPDTVFHIFKCNIDGSGLTQLTFGNWNDFDACWLPDGDIVFISERRGGYGRCHMRPVPTYTLHRMKPDGSEIRCISYHETNEWNPSVDNHGMIIYTRWDYVDRGATHMHSAWITWPDGTDARSITLNYPIPHSGRYRRAADTLGRIPLMQMSLRAIPNSNKYVGIAASHHGQNYGPIIMIDPDVEDDDHHAQITNLTPNLNGGAGYPETSGGRTRFATPYPLSEDLFLCVYDRDERRYGISLLDTSGPTETIDVLYRDPNISCFEPIPVRPRPKPNAITPSKRPEGQTTTVIPVPPSGGAVVENIRPKGTVFVYNVYDSLLEWPEGTNITALRIWQIFPKSTPNSNSPRISYEATQSDWSGRSTRGLLGSVPVEEDGSAYFYLPSGIQVFLQAINEDGIAMQSMRSGIFIIPGQTSLNCQGCHEPRHSVPQNPDYIPLALRREPSTIEPDPSPGAWPVSFPRLVQPVLNERCVSCHNGTIQGAPDLRGTVTSTGTSWFRSYVNLRNYVFTFDGFYNGDWDQNYPRTEPGRFGARASALYTKLKDGHCKDLTEEELHRIAIWLDSGIAPFYGEYNNTSSQRSGNQVDPLFD